MKPNTRLFPNMGNVFSKTQLWACLQALNWRILAHNVMCFQTHKIIFYVLVAITMWDWSLNTFLPHILCVRVNYSIIWRVIFHLGCYPFWTHIWRGPKIKHSSVRGSLIDWNQLFQLLGDNWKYTWKVVSRLSALFY